MEENKQEKKDNEVRVKMEYAPGKESWKSIWDLWGARLERGAYEALLTPPSLKNHVENKSRLYDGAEVLVNQPKLEERSVSFTITIRGATQEEYLKRYTTFVNKLQSGWFELRIPALNNAEFKLLYESCTKLGNYGLKVGKFSLKFREPVPKRWEKIVDNKDEAQVE